MQDLLTASVEFIVVAFTIAAAMDFVTGMSALVDTRRTGQRVAAPTPQLEPVADNAAFVDDPWEGEVELVVFSPVAVAAHPPQLLLAPAPSDSGQSANPYEGWSIRQLKREAAVRKIKAYSFLTKAQLIQRLTA
jgi:hypothetical protein